ncbi:PREDICTED: PACRG-like protein [Priapulus caudatus]|uniref:PACRG-like protein n=1 Tax=Priapulus caudatus TaxID=37621 RepID=A0ABM1ET21_PRICU|nr:PREDICTED: PACRG-like protein [Priapulus caudatus]XP_014675343.1 PREDICTED: PACRG-like protein [Priapulus caudatus]
MSRDTTCKSSDDNTKGLGVVVHSQRTNKSAPSLHGAAATVKKTSRSNARLPKNRGSGSSVGDTPKAPSKKAPRPSDSLNPKTIDPFADASKPKSAFAATYSSGDIPCRLEHGNVKHKISWSTHLNQIPFNPVLVYLAEGLRETKHPYNFVAKTGFRELLRADGAKEKATPLVPKLIQPIKLALMHSDDGVFEGTLEALMDLSKCVGPALTPHLKNLLMPLSKRMMTNTFREKVWTALQCIETAGGKECLAIIKAKVPTYSSVM